MINYVYVISIPTKLKVMGNGPSMTVSLLIIFQQV
uniref:Uncharacterized protein n=1 Tax=Arundo donax TaxID=35708 RepID=A0A0A9CG83_ARUDO